MNRPAAALTLVCIILAACREATFAPFAEVPLFAQQAPGHWYPIASFDEDVTFKIRSDGHGAYIDGSPSGYVPPNCVVSELEASGFYMLRTVRNTTACQDIATYEERRFTFDLGAPLEDLDGDGAKEALEEATGRFLVDKATGKTSTPVTILVGPGPMWEVRYQKGVTTRDGVAGARILEAVPGDAAADLYARVLVKERLVSQFRRTVQLPFKLTLAP